MKIKIIGSGGCVSTPRPCCDCRVCKEAREKGFPYARTGCSIYIEEIETLIDTPEDINYALNHANVSKVEQVLYSHADPDHTMGMRVFEQLKMDWLGCSVDKKNENLIEVLSLPKVIEELRKQKTFRGSVLDYYVWRGLITVNGSYYVEKGDILKDGFILKLDNPLREELFIMEEILEIKEQFHIKNVIVTHLEEDWGKSYDDYAELEKEYDGIRFAYDGMEVEL